MPTPRRSAFADLLAASPHALVDDAAFTLRDRWHPQFAEKIGPRFNRRLVLEIGCNDAEFLARVAAKHPDMGFVGLDWKYRALHMAAERIGDAQLKNVTLLRARAQDVSRLFAPGELDEIWIFHPDPCDRDVELANRLIAEPFLVDAHRALRASGDSVFALKTDHPGYYQWTLALLGLAQPRWFTRHEVNSPRTKVKELMKPGDLPATSLRAKSLFDVTSNSADLWQDAAALSHVATRAFAGDTTTYESRFRRKRLPIYYIELRPRLAGATSDRGNAPGPVSLT